MTTESIDKARQQAKELGIYEIIHNIYNITKTNANLEWEGCTIKFRVIEPSKIASSSTSSNGYYGGVAAAMASAVASTRGVHATSITMPDGTILYRIEGDTPESQTVTDFRFGKWVERITEYSNEITAKREKEKREKLAKEKEELLKPFSEIDF